MSPRVSVVVPSYQNADFIEATIESVLAQTFTDLELVVADHGSTDGTWDLLQRFTDDPRVRLLQTPAGGGAQRNWNAVSQAATGDLIKLVCGDDVLYPEMLRRQVDALDAAGDGAVLVASRRDIVDADGRPAFRGQGLKSLEGVVDGRRAVRASVLAGTNVLGEPCCVTMRRDVLEKTGWWGDGVHRYLIDQAAYARVLFEGDLVALHEPMAAFRLSATQWSVELAREQWTQAAEFHAELRERDPALLSARDVRVGDVKARLRSYQRRAAYLWLGSRMQRSAT
ncbi:glycosyltransferase family 2 protein [Solicola sp. PLA-1-18]|uniref:glycosyltransferase family 2 protein n=1 Tax=Solicola sp. PLA-1-18 TaxID=3380532 RepID=UPI003B7F96C7